MQINGLFPAHNGLAGRLRESGISQQCWDGKKSGWELSWVQAKDVLPTENLSTQVRLPKKGKGKVFHHMKILSMYRINCEQSARQPLSNWDKNGEGQRQMVQNEARKQKDQ